MLSTVSVGIEVAQEGSSNEDEYRPNKMPSLRPESDSMDAIIGEPEEMGWVAVNGKQGARWGRGMVSVVVNDQPAVHAEGLFSQPSKIH